MFPAAILGIAPGEMQNQSYNFAACRKEGGECNLLPRRDIGVIEPHGYGISDQSGSALPFCEFYAARVAATANIELVHRQ